MKDGKKRKVKVNEWVELQVYVSQKDVHYAGGLVNGAFIISLFGDVATLLSVMFDGDEGLLAAYKNIELLKPVYAGEFIRLKARVSRVGNTSRDVELEAWRIVRQAVIPEQPSAADYLDEPELVARAVIVSVVPKDCMRYTD